jgi:hypothetical protein
VGIAKSGVQGYLAGGDKAQRNTIYQPARSNSDKSIREVVMMMQVGVPCSKYFRTVRGRNLQMEVSGG